MQAFPSVLRRYGLAAVFVLFALLLTRLLPLLSHVAVFLVPLTAVILSAWYGGRGPGLAAIMLSAVTVNHFFIRPVNAFSISPFENAMGIVLFMVVALLMVEFGTIRKQSERAFRESNERLNLAQEAAGAGVWEWNIKTGEMNWSEQYYRLLGLQAEGMPASYDNWFRFIHPDDQDRVRAAVDDARFGRRPLAEEYRFIKPDGHIQWMIRRGRRFDDGHGRPERMVGITLDITTRKRAEEILRESEGRWRAVFENSAVGIALTGLDGRFIITNAAYQRIVGYTADELGSRAFLDVVQDEDRSLSKALIADLVRGAVPQFQTEQRCRCKDGRVRYVAISASLVPGTQTTSTYFLAIVDDITEQKQAQADLLQVSGRLLHVQDEERRRLARELHDSTAQELTALFMKLAVVKHEEAVLSREAQKALVESDALAHSTYRGIRTLSYLLHPPLLETSGLTQALGWYIDGFIQRSGIAVRIDVPPDFPRLPTEVETALFRIVQESLTNVLHHSNSHSADVRVAIEEGTVVLEVRDEGRGMREGLRGILKDDVSGLGVGIMGMRERVKQLHGRLDIASADSGTTVRAILPLALDLSLSENVKVSRVRGESSD